MRNLNERQSEIIWTKALREATWAFAMAAIALSLLFVTTFFFFHPDLTRFSQGTVQPLSVSGSELLAISIGEGHKDNGHYVISDFNKDEAILVSEQQFRAEDFPFVKINLEGLTSVTTVKLLWQKAGDPEIYSRELNRDGDGLTQLALALEGEDYSGTIASIALLFYDGPALGFQNNDDVDITIRNIEFRAFSLWRVIEQIYCDWINPPLWGASSINTVEGVHPRQLLKPNIAANLLVVTGLVLVFCRRQVHRIGRNQRLHSPVFAVALGLCLHGWVFNESLRWFWRVEQLVDGSERYAGLHLEQRIRNNEVRCGMYSSDCASFLYPYF